MDYKIVQNAPSVCVELCRLHTKLKIFSQESMDNSRVKYKNVLDEIKINPHVGSIKVRLKLNDVRHDLM